MFPFMKSTGPPLRRPLCLCNLIIISLILIYSYFFQTRISYESMHGNAVSVYGTVIGKEMHKSAGGTELYLILKQENNCCFVCSVLTEEEPVIGSYVCISGTFYIYERATNPGQFDAAQYYASQRIYGRILTESCFVIRPPSGITGVFFRGKEQLFKFRRYLCSRLFQLFGAENGALLSAMLLGERVFLDEEIKSVYRDAGIFHIVAISGLHISLLGMGLFSLLFKMFQKVFSKKPQAALMGAALFSVIVMGVYTLMTGMSSSAMRAFSVFAILLLAKCLKRTFDTLTALSCCAVWLLFLNPGYAQQSGFLMSFSAILGITLLKPALTCTNTHNRLYYKNTAIFSHAVSPLSKWLQGLLEKSLNWMAEGFLTSLCVWFFTLPVQLWFFYEVSLAGLLLNLIVIPLAGTVLLSCLAAIAFYHIKIFLLWLSGEIIYILPAGMCSDLISEAGVLLPAALENISCKVASLILFLYKSCGMAAAGMEKSIWTPGKPSFFQIVSAYAIMSLLIYISNREREFPFRYKAGLLLGVILIFMPVREKDLTITFLDVGQGDCICMEVPDNGVYLFDGGSSSVKGAGTYRLEPFLKSKGIRHLNAVFLSHGDEDHVNAVLELMNNTHFTIDMIVLPDRSTQTLEEEFGSILAAAGARKIDLRCIAAGNSVQLDDITILCLNPQAMGDRDIGDSNVSSEQDIMQDSHLSLDSNISLDSNDGSEVFYITYGNFSLLLTGDLEKEGEEYVTTYLRQYDISKATVLKVAHHGSRNSTGTEFLNRLSPDVAVISCGKNNRYGHPHEETVKQLETAGVSIYRTDEAGAITITAYNNGNEVNVTEYVTR